MSRRRVRGVGAWAVAATLIALAVAWFTWQRTYAAGGIAIVVAALAVAGAVAVSAWPKTKEPTTLLAVVGIALAAIGTGAGVDLLSSGRHPTVSPQPPAQTVPASLRTSGPTLRIFNKVTSGAHAMRDDNQHPAYLSSVPENFCKRRGCANPKTNLFTGDTVSPAVCQTKGERVTNGDDSAAVDNHNPGLATSTRWYAVRRPDDTLAYLSEVWVVARQRGGLGLPRCPRG